MYVNLYRTRQSQGAIHTYVVGRVVTWKRAHVLRARPPQTTRLVCVGTIRYGLLRGLVATLCGMIGPRAFTTEIHGMGRIAHSSRHAGLWDAR